MDCCPYSKRSVLICNALHILSKSRYCHKKPSAYPQMANKHVMTISLSLISAYSSIGASLGTLYPWGTSAQEPLNVNVLIYYELRKYNALIFQQYGQLLLQ